MADGALGARSGPFSIGYAPIAHTVASGQGAANGRARIIKADPGAGGPAISGGEPYSGATIDG